MDPKFMIISIIIKILLLGFLTYYVKKVRMSIDIADAISIKNNFKTVEILTYIIVLFNYGIFATKYFNKSNDRHKSNKSKKHHCGMKKINLILTLLLLVFMMQTKSAINIAEKGPVPISFLSDNFRLTENITYVTLGFNVLTSGIMLISEHGDKFNISPSSLKSLSF